MADLIKKTGGSGFESVSDAGKSQESFFPMSPNLYNAQLGLKDDYTMTHPSINPIKSKLTKTHPDLLSLEEGESINSYLNAPLTATQQTTLYGVVAWVHKNRHIDQDLERKIQILKKENQRFITLVIPKGEILDILHMENNKENRKEITKVLRSLIGKSFFIENIEQDRKFDSFFECCFVSSVGWAKSKDHLEVSFFLGLMTKNKNGGDLIYENFDHRLRLLEKSPKHSNNTLKLMLFAYVTSQQKQKENKISLKTLAFRCNLDNYIENREYKKIQKLFDKYFEELKEIGVIQDWCSNTNKKGEVIYNFINFDRDKKNNKIQQIPAIPCHEIVQAKSS